LLQVYEFSKQDAQKASELEIDLEKNGQVLTTSLMNAAIVINKGGSLYALDKDFNEHKNMGSEVIFKNIIRPMKYNSLNINY
jgi:predicted nucleic acid-binding protein